MKHPAIAKQANAYARAFSFVDFCTQFDKQRLNVSPRNAAADRSSENQIERSLMFLFHGEWYQNLVSPASSTPVTRNHLA